MPTGDFEQKTVLVGQQGISAAFGVSDDPMLMSMLSTGFYGNPLRTMIQEVMFNAWDAHKMGNCTDKPIEVHINDTVGLIIRDFGPGISKEDIVPVYCIYGNSTKRGNKGQTGGFGLGSKSPFAYTDTFSVTSHHAGLKNMYVVNRVSDDNDGKPGLVGVLQDIPTEETGLSVTIPLLNKDMHQALLYFQDLAEMSGWNVDIHYGEDKLYEIRDRGLAPSEWIIDDEVSNSANLNAVFGGVRYAIPERSEYAQEYRFLSAIVEQMGDIFIGFPPNSLVPLPNREGLNMNAATVDAIKTQLEIIQEDLRGVTIPATEAVCDCVAEILSEQGIQPQYIPFRWSQFGPTKSANDIVDRSILQERMALRGMPEGVRPSLWKSITNLLMTRNSNFWGSVIINLDDFYVIRTKAIMRHIPEMREFARFLSVEQIPMGASSTNDIFPNWMRRTNVVLRELKDLTGQKLQLRMLDREYWRPMTPFRNTRKIKERPTYMYNQKANESFKKHMRERKPEPVAVDDRLWWQHSGEQFSETMMEKTIILAKKASELNDFSFNLDDYFAPDAKTQRSRYYHRSPYSHYHFYSGYQNSSIPALVVRNQKGNYETAKAHLESLGYNVIEVPEAEIEYETIETSVDATPVVKEVPKFRKLDRMRRHWESWEGEGLEAKEVKTFINITQTALDDYDRTAKTSDSMLFHIQERWPETVVVWNKRQNAKLERGGAVHISDRIESKVKVLLKNEERIRRMYLHTELQANANLPEVLLSLPEVQKQFNVPYIRSADKDKFNRDRRFLESVMDERHHETVSPALRDKVKIAFNKHQMDPVTEDIRKVGAKADILDKYELRKLAQSMKPGEIKCLSEKILRLLRTL